MGSSGRVLLLAGMSVFVWSVRAESPALAVGACVNVGTPAELNAMRNNLAGSYCLTRDLDMAGVANFAPIGTHAAPFTGSFHGNGHVIRNLQTNPSAIRAGLFGRINDGAVSNLTLARVRVKSTVDNALAGGLVGYLSGKASVSGVRVTGTASCTGHICRVGGLVGEMANTASVSQSSAAVSVSGGHGGAAGGLAGQSSATIAWSYATGQVLCGSNCAAGGLVGDTIGGGKITQSFSTGPVRSSSSGVAGGLVGRLGGTTSQSFATGWVTSSVNAAVGGLSGDQRGPVAQAYAAGPLSAGAPSDKGGLTALNGAAQAKFMNSYWDKDTTGQNTSAVGGTPLTTAQLQAALPAGFNSAVWDITKGFSYPFLNNPTHAIDFVSPLATLVHSGRPFTFVPLSQNEPTEYARPPAHADAASLAAVYTMVARAIGLTLDKSTLKAAYIDTYFWDDAQQKASWSGPVTTLASLGAVLAISGAAKIDDSNIIGAIKSGHPVIIRGTYHSGAVARTHWMLATLFKSNTGGDLLALVANDPWTRRQVLISPTTKRVVSPPGFPLGDFTVDRYQVVTLN